MTLMVSPQDPGLEFDSPESAVPFHQAAGWVVKGSDDDPEVIAAAEAEKDSKTSKPGKDAEKDKAPKAGATAKDGES